MKAVQTMLVPRNLNVDTEMLLLAEVKLKNMMKLEPIVFPSVVLEPIHNYTPNKDDKLSLAYLGSSESATNSYQYFCMAYIDKSGKITACVSIILTWYKDTNQIKQHNYSYTKPTASIKFTNKNLSLKDVTNFFKEGRLSVDLYDPSKKKEKSREEFVIECVVNSKKTVAPIVFMNPLSTIQKAALIEYETNPSYSVHTVGDGVGFVVTKKTNVDKKIRVYRDVNDSDQQFNKKIDKVINEFKQEMKAIDCGVEVTSIFQYERKQVRVNKPEFDDFLD